MISPHCDVSYVTIVTKRYILFFAVVAMNEGLAFLSIVVMFCQQIILRIL